MSFVKEVMEWSANDAVQSPSITLTAAIAAGNFAVILWEQGSDATDVLASVSDSKNSTNWTVLTPSTTGSTSYCCGIAYGQIATALLIGDTITLSWTNATFVAKAISILEFSGVATSSPLDVQATVGDTFANTAVSIPVTTTNANDVLVAIVAQLHAQTYAVAGSFTDQANQSDSNGRRSDYLYQIVSATGTYDPAGSLGTADSYRGAIAAFKVAASAVAVLPDADLVTTGWSTPPLFSKVNDASDASVITATLA